MQRKLLHIAAATSNAAMIITAAVIFLNAYGTGDKMLAALLFVPPVLSLIALCKGPDKEERELDEAVRKARLRKELKDLQETK